MAQECIKMNGIVVPQPDTGLGYDFETTYTEDSTRMMNGKLFSNAMFTVEAFSYEITDVTQADMKTVLQIVARGRPFTLHYLSPYYGQWRDGSFYVGQGSLSVGSWKADEERYDHLSFNMIGVDPI